MQRYIGLSGLAGSGKDSVANLFVDKYEFTQIALADPLKRLIRDIFDFSIDDLWGPSQNRNKLDYRYPRQHDMIGGICACCGGTVENDCYLTIRYALQLAATEWARRCYENVWVDYNLRIAQKLMTQEDGPWVYQKTAGLVRRPGPELAFHKEIPLQPAGIIFSDVRFINEFNAIKEVGGIMVRVVRDTAGLKGSAALHQSESEQLTMPDSMFDYVLHNDSELSELEDKIKVIYDFMEAQ